MTTDKGMIRMTIYPRRAHARMRDILFKFTSCLLIISFLTMEVLYPFNAAQAAGELTGLTSVGPEGAGSQGLYKELNVATFSIPEYLGSVKDSWAGAGGEGEVVVHIQDAHCNYAAQHVINGIIEHLSRSYNVSTINLEGGVKEYDLSIFTRIPDARIREKVADDYVKEGLVSGAEYFAINNPDKAYLWGVEDTQLYLENLSIYRESLKYKEQVERILNTIGHILTNLKTRLYTPQLLDLDMKYSQYKAGTLSFRDYLTYLVELLKKTDQGLKDFEDLRVLATALEREDKIDFKKANAERDQLIDRLRRSLSKVELEELVLKTLAFKTDKISHAVFYEYLVKKSNELDVRISDYPDLERYIGYIALYGRVDKVKVIFDIQQAEDRAREKLCRTDEERELATLSKNLTLMKNLFSVELTKEDYSYYTQNSDSFAMKRYIDFISKYAPLYGIQATLDQDSGELDERRESITRFYECSLKRDDAFLKNMRYDQKKRPVVLVTGGFHTDNLLKLFKEQGIRYISIIPNFKNREDFQNPYFALLAGEVTGLEKRLYSVISTKNTTAQSSAIQVASIQNALLATEVWGDDAVLAHKAAVVVHAECVSQNAKVVDVDKEGVVLENEEGKRWTRLMTAIFDQVNTPVRLEGDIGPKDGVPEVPKALQPPSDDVDLNLLFDAKAVDMIAGLALIEDETRAGKAIDVLAQFPYRMRDPTDIRFQLNKLATESIVSIGLERPSLSGKCISALQLIAMADYMSLTMRKISIDGMARIAAKYPEHGQSTVKMLNRVLQNSGDAYQNLSGREAANAIMKLAGSVVDRRFVFGSLVLSVMGGCKNEVAALEASTALVGVSSDDEELVDTAYATMKGHLLKGSRQGDTFNVAADTVLLIADRVPRYRESGLEFLVEVLERAHTQNNIHPAALHSTFVSLQDYMGNRMAHLRPVVSERMFRAVDAVARDIDSGKIKGVSMILAGGLLGYVLTESPQRATQESVNILVKAAQTKVSAEEIATEKIRSSLIIMVKSLAMIADTRPEMISQTLAGLLEIVQKSNTVTVANTAVGSLGELIKNNEGVEGSGMDIFERILSEGYVIPDAYEQLMKELTEITDKHPKKVRPSTISALVKAVDSNRYLSDLVYSQMMQVISSVGSQREEMSEQARDALEHIVSTEGLPSMAAYEEAAQKLVSLCKARMSLVLPGSVGSVMIALPKNMYGHAYPHYEIYVSRSFKEMVQGMPDEIAYSIGLAAYRLLTRFNIEKNELNIVMAIQYIFEKRAELKDRIVFGNGVRVVNICHQEKRFDITAMAGLEESCGVQRKDVSSQQGMSQTTKHQVETEIPGVMRDVEMNAKDGALYEIARQSSMPLTVFFEGHGGRNHIWLDSGLPGNELSDDMKRKDAISYVELGDALLARGRLEDVTVLISSCFSYNFSRNLIYYLNKKGVQKMPLIVSSSNMDRYSYGASFLTAISSIILPTLSNGVRPMVMDDVFSAEVQMFRYQDAAIFSDLDKSEIESIFGIQAIDIHAAGMIGGLNIPAASTGRTGIELPGSLIGSWTAELPESVAEYGYYGSGSAAEFNRGVYDADQSESLFASIESMVDSVTTPDDGQSLAVDLTVRLPGLDAPDARVRVSVTVQRDDTRKDIFKVSDDGKTIIISDRALSERYPRLEGIDIVMRSVVIHELAEAAGIQLSARGFGYYTNTRHEASLTLEARLLKYIATEGREQNALRELWASRGVLFGAGDIAGTQAVEEGRQQAAKNLLSSVRFANEPRVFFIPDKDMVNRSPHVAVSHDIRKYLEKKYGLNIKVMLYDGTEEGLAQAYGRAGGDLQKENALALAFVGPGQDAIARKVFGEDNKQVKWIQEDVPEGVMADEVMHIVLGLGILDYVRNGARADYDTSKLLGLLEQMTASPGDMETLKKDFSAIFKLTLKIKKIDFKEVEEWKKAQDMVLKSL